MAGIGPRSYNLDSSLFGGQKMMGSNVATGLQTAGTGMSIFGMGSPISWAGFGLNALGAGINIWNAHKSRQLARGMEPLQVTRAPEIEAPDLRVTAQERAAAGSLLDAGYATTVKAGELYGRDMHGPASASRIEGARKFGADFAGINRQAAQVELQTDAINQGVRAKENAAQDYYTFQTEAMKAGIETQAMHTIPQTLLDFGQSAVSLGNVHSSMNMMKDMSYSSRLSDLTSAHRDAISTNNYDLASSIMTQIVGLTR